MYCKSQMLNDAMMSPGQFDSLGAKFLDALVPEIPQRANSNKHYVSRRHAGS